MTNHEKRIEAIADPEHDRIVDFIEKLQCLPIRMSSNANQDYIEMGESIYHLAKQFFRGKK